MNQDSDETINSEHTRRLECHILRFEFIKFNSIEIRDSNVWWSTTEWQRDELFKIYKLVDHIRVIYNNKSLKEFAPTPHICRWYFSRMFLGLVAEHECRGNKKAFDEGRQIHHAWIKKDVRTYREEYKMRLVWQLTLFSRFIFPIHPVPHAIMMYKSLSIHRGEVAKSALIELKTIWMKDVKWTSARLSV